MKKLLKRTMALVMAFTMMLMMQGISISAMTKTKIDLGTYVKTWKVSDAQALALTDGDTDTTITVNRNVGKPYLTYVVYDAGEGKSFDFNKVVVYGGGEIRLFGTNNDKIATTDPGTDVDYTSDSYAVFKSYFEAAWIGTTTSSLLSESFENQPSDYRYLAVVLSNWPSTTIAEFELYNMIYDDGVNDVLFYDDIEFVQGTSGNFENSPITKVSNLSLLAPFDITSEEQILNQELYRVNALDSSAGSQWTGYGVARIQVDTAGEYRIYILGTKGNNDTSTRKYKLTVNSSDEYSMPPATAENKVGDVTNAFAAVMACDVVLQTGMNTIKFQGDTAAPNFMALTVKEIPKHPVSIKDKDGTLKDYEVTDGKIMVCRSTVAVAWKVNGAVIAMGKEFSFVPSETTTIEAVEITDDMKATEAVVTGTDLAANKFIVTYGSDLTENDSLSITFTADDGAYGQMVLPVTADVIGKQVEYTMVDSAKTIIAVQVKAATAE
ncbi:MAG: hypothetical protein ACI4CT_04780 [Lachnospiraceae bacterium]